MVYAIFGVNRRRAACMGLRGDVMLENFGMQKRVYKNTCGPLCWQRRAATKTGLGYQHESAAIGNADFYKTPGHSRAIEREYEKDLHPRRLDWTNLRRDH